MLLCTCALSEHRGPLCELHRLEVQNLGRPRLAGVVIEAAGNNEALTKQGTAHQNLVRGADYVHTGFLELEVANASHSFVRFIRSRRPSRFGPENSSCFQQLFLGPPKYLLLSLRGIPMENWLSGHTCERVRIASAGSHDGLVGDEGVLVKSA